MSKLRFNLPVDFNVGRPSVQFEQKFVELAHEISGHQLELGWDDTAFRKAVGPDGVELKITRAQQTYGQLLHAIFGMPEDLAEREARRLDERGEKEALWQLFRALLTRRYPLPVDRLYDRFGLVVRDEATYRTIRDLHSPDGFSEGGMVDTFGFETPALSKDDVPRSVPLRDARKALLCVAAGAQTIITDSVALVEWLNTKGVHTLLVSADWMALDFRKCGPAELDCMISLLSPLGEVHGLAFDRNLPAVTRNGKRKEVRPLVAWAAHTVHVYDTGWAQLAMTLAYAIDATFGGNEKAQRRKFLGRFELMPIWDDSEVYTEDDPLRKAIVAVAAKVVAQKLSHSGRMEVRTIENFECADVLPLVRRLPGYSNAIGHDQGHCIYLHGERLQMLPVTEEQADALRAANVMTNHGRLVNQGDIVLATDKVNKVRKRHTLPAATSFEPLEKAVSRLRIGGGQLEGVRIPLAICRTGISAQEGDAVIVNKPVWQQMVAHHAFHTMEGRSAVALTPKVREGDFVEVGQTLLKGEGVQVKATHRGRVVHVGVFPEDEEFQWDVLLDEVRRGGDVKFRTMAIKVSAHPYPQALSPWDHDQNPARDLLPAGLVVMQGGFKGEIAYGLLQVLCDTLGINLDYDPVAHALGEYDGIFARLPELEHECVNRWVITPEEQELWEARDLTLNGAPVPDGAGGTFQLVTTEHGPTLYHATTALIGYVVGKIEASGVEDAVGKTAMPLEVSYWMDAVGLPAAAMANFRRGQEQFEVLKRLHAMNLS